VSIKLFCLDIDGCLTDGCYYVRPDITRIFKFNTRDMHGLTLLCQNKVKLAVVSMSDNQTIIPLMQKMPFMIDIRLKVMNKLSTVQSMAEEYGIGMDEIAYIGDDVSDIPILQNVGMSACPFDAEDEVLRMIAKKDDGWIMERKGGYGCVREFANLVLSMYNG